MLWNVPATKTCHGSVYEPSSLNCVRNGVSVLQNRGLGLST
jgi:hypothetical protein